MKTFILANLLCVIAAFPLHDRKVHFRVRVSQLWTSRQLDSDLHRAIQCAERYGLCDVDELLKLAEELESLKGSVYEQDFPDMTLELCEKEIDDRREVVEILRLQSDLRRRQESLRSRNGNLFQENVHRVHEIQDRDEYIEQMNVVSDT